MITTGKQNHTNGKIPKLRRLFFNLFYPGKFFTKKSFLCLLILSTHVHMSRTQTFCESLPQYAQNTEFQCRNRQHFGLVVHGLWPQVSKASSVRAHPRNCRNEKQLNATVIKRYYCMMPDEDLIQSQWEIPHCESQFSPGVSFLGTCYFKTATEYYQTIENLYGALNIPDIASMKSATAADVKSTFLTLNPTLIASAIQVSMDYEKRLKEIKICYDLKQKFVRCSL